MNLFQKTMIIVLFGAHTGLCKTNSNVRHDIERYESVVLPATQIRKIHSSQTNQNYRIYVNIPASYYKEPSAVYAALFVLDADYSFALAKQTSEHLSDRGHIPEMFIFGIAYDGPLDYRTNRTRDYTPTHVPDGGYGPEFQKHSGGGIAFANFLEKELILYIEKHFRISKERGLVGHSYGGLFTSWMMLSRPSAFTGYISVSPSLWYDNKMIFDVLNRREKSAGVSTRAFFGIGDAENRGEHRMVDDMNRFTRILRDTSRSDIALNSVVFSGENHDTVFPAALTRGIMYLFGTKSHD